MAKRASKSVMAVIADLVNQAHAAAASGDSETAQELAQQAKQAMRDVRDQRFLAEYGPILRAVEQKIVPHEMLFNPEATPRGVPAGFNPEVAPPATTEGVVAKAAKGRRPRDFMDKLLVRAKAATRGTAARGVVSEAAGAVSAAKAAGGMSKLMKVGGLGLVGALASFAPEIYKGVRSNLGGIAEGGPADRDLQGLLQARRRAADVQRANQRRLQQLRTTMDLNTQRLATIAPHLFNEGMAGRRLPIDATVIGGEPRSDLMEEVAGRMAMGSYGSGDPNQLPVPLE